MPRAYNARVSATLIFAALLALSGSLGAQNVATECIAVDVVGKPPNRFVPEWRIRHPDSLYAAMLPRMHDDQWVLLADSLVQAHARQSDAIAEPARSILGVQLDFLRAEFVAAARSGDLDRARELGLFVSADRFTESQLPSGRTVIFSRFGTELALDTTWSTEQRRAVCGLTIAIRRMLIAWGEPARHEALLALQESARRWDNLSEYGYFMYPWELAINSAGFDPRSDDPPSAQWVFLHPAVGLEYIDRPTERSLKHLRVQQTLTVELGRLWYSDDRTQHRGATAFLAIPSDAVIGAGVMLHVNRQIKLGYVLRARDALGDRRDGFLVSADIAQMLAAAPKKLQAAQEALRQRIWSLKEDVVRRAVPK